MKFNGSITSKLPRVGTNIFTQMSALSNQEGAINLSQGFPDFDLDPNLIDLVRQKMSSGLNQYAPMQGTLALRESIAAKLYNTYGAVYDPASEIVVTAGATQAIYTVITALVHEGDEVIMFTPAYDCYAPAIQLSGGEPVYVQMHYPDYAIDWQEVKKLVNRRTKMIIINTPHNPSGKVLGPSDMDELERITAGNDILILSDEVYEHIIFDQAKHESVCKYESLRERSLAIYSFGKTFHCTGWKMGYCVGPENLMKEFQKVHQFNVFAVNHPIQAALADYIKHESSYNTIAPFYQEKRNYFEDLLSTSRFEVIKSEGSYFQLVSYKNISDEIDTDFCVRLTKERKVSAIPISVFYHNPVHEGVIRFCFAKKPDTLKKAAEILCKI
jgi:methionine aminotransferase